METVNYDGVVERWKVDLIATRARRMGFRPDEIPDIQQQIILDVMAFRFDADKSNGAKEPAMDSTNEMPMLITREEAARLLTISERKLWELTNARQVPCVRIGRAVRYVARDLREWVKTRRNGRIRSSLSPLGHRGTVSHRIENP